jgi:hypothetical protein
MTPPLHVKSCTCADLTQPGVWSTPPKKIPLTCVKVEFCWVGLAIFGVRLGQACAQLTHSWVKFSWVAQRRFSTAPSLCHRPNCPLTSRTKQRIGRIVHGSDCRSQRLDPLLKGRTERFGCGQTARPLWGRIVSI